MVESWNANSGSDAASSNKRTAVDVKRSAATARGSRLSSSAASRGSTRRPNDHSSVRLRFFVFDTFPFARLFDAPPAPTEEPALALAFPRIVAASSSFPSRNMRMAVSA